MPKRQPSFFDITNSIGGKRWRARLVDDRGALAIAQRFNLPEVLGRVLSARGVAVEDAESFLNPKIRDLLPDPLHLLDMDKAIARIISAIEGGEKIGVFADYDVDGACSASILTRFLSEIGREVTVYVPDRVIEGYGPNSAALMKLKDEGVTLVLTVDCGTTAFEPLEAAAKNGLDVIVIDHHVAEPLLPDAVAIVNPNRFDETSAVGQLCAAGVVFLLVVALNRELRERFWYEEGHNEPDLMAWVDLVALATVADVVKLTGVNRALVKNGLSVMGKRENHGIAALANIVDLNQKPEAWHLGFLLGPRVNAGGRVGEPGLGVRLLTTTDPDEAATLAVQLDKYNSERREIEAAVLASAMAQAERQAVTDSPLIVVAAEGWHPGVIGIVAARIKDTFNRPTCVISLEKGLGKGSGRSVRGVELGPAIIAAQQADYLINGGGHAMAAGFTLLEERIEGFKEFLAEHISGQLGGRVLVPELGVDGALSVEGANLDLIEILDKAGPYGAGNPRPRFVLTSVKILSPKNVGIDHVSCLLGAPESSARIRAISFRSLGKPIGEALMNGRGASLHVAGHLNVNDWQGEKKPQFVIEDVARPV